jgi:hypothetical protein
MFLLAIGASFALSGVASATIPEGSSAPWIQSDKPDYAPGETVVLTGGNWAAGEVVHITVNDDEGMSWRRDVDVTAAADGAIADTFSLPDWFVALYTVTATGPESGTATTTFTDATSAITFAISPTLLTPGATLTWSASATCTGPMSGSQSCAAGGTSVGGAVPNGYTIELVRFDSTCSGTKVTEDSVGTTSGSTGSRAVAAPSTPGVYCYRAEHPSQSISGVTWAAANSSTILVNVVNLDSYASVSCETSTTAVNSFTSGTEVCAKAFAVPNTFNGRIDWVDPSVNVDDTDTFTGGLTSNRAVARFTPTDCGTWTTKLYDNASPTPNLIDTDTFTVTACDTDPVVTAPANQMADEGTSTSFNLGSFTDPDGGPWDVVVNWGDGSTDTTINDFTPAGSLGTASHTYADGPDTHMVTVTVTDSTGRSDSATFQVTVANVDPTVTLSGDATANEGQNKTYSFTTSDPGDEVFSLDSVSCGTGGNQVGTATFNSSTGAGSFVCNFPDGPASPTVSATVSDGDGGSDSDSIAATVTNVAPGVTAAFANGSVGCGTNNATLDIMFTDPGDDDPWEVVIDWGDSSSDDTFSENAPGSFSKSHTYGSAGVYNATVTVTEENGTGASGSDATNSLTVNYNVVGGGFLQPVNNTRNGQSPSLFKYGSTVPLKLEVTDCDGSHPDDLQVKVTWAKLSGTTPYGETEAVATNSPDAGNLMRFVDSRYMFNWNTKVLSDPTCTVRIQATIMETGQMIYSDIGLRK